jgi:carotenoid cleavage dioxygenase-like enzyme
MTYTLEAAARDVELGEQKLEALGTRIYGTLQTGYTSHMNIQTSNDAIHTVHLLSSALVTRYYEPSPRGSICKKN